MDFPHSEDALAPATTLRDTVRPAMVSLRTAADTLDGLVADDLWSLPTYREMLFIL